MHVPDRCRSSFKAQLQGRALGQAVGETRPGLFAAPAFDQALAAEKLDASAAKPSPTTHPPSAESPQEPSSRLRPDQQGRVDRASQHVGISSDAKSEPSATVMSFSSEDAAFLPTVVLMHGVQDLTVPW